MDRNQPAGPPAPLRRSAGEWRELVGEFEASGETLKAWCAPAAGFRRRRFRTGGAGSEGMGRSRRLWRFRIPGRRRPLRLSLISAAAPFSA